MQVPICFLFRCGNGECLAGIDHHCDYDWDCQDGSDEQDCPVLNCEKVKSLQDYQTESSKGCLPLI